MSQLNERPQPAPLNGDVFWMVYLVNGAGPSFRHATEGQAHAEARRLALLHNSTAYVLKAESKISIAHSTVTEPLHQPLPDEAYTPAPRLQHT